jgi:hypothetical protein
VLEPLTVVPAVGLFIDSKSLIGDGASLDLAMVEAKHLFRRASRRHWSVVAAARCECRKNYGWFYSFLSFRIFFTKCLGQRFSPGLSLSFSFHVCLLERVGMLV